MIFAVVVAGANLAAGGLEEAAGTCPRTVTPASRVKW